MEKKILILASTSFIGQNIKKYFEKKNYDIHILNKRNVNFINKDLLHENIKNINPEIVINCCGIVGSSIKNKSFNDFDILNENIILNTNVLESCKNLNIKKIILMSSYRVFGDNIHENYDENSIQKGSIEYNIGYLTSKKILDIQIKLFMNEYKIDVVCLLLTNIYGSNDDFSINSRIVPSLITKIKMAHEMNNNIIIESNKNVLVNLVFVEDVSKIIERIIFDGNCNNIKGNIIVFNKKGIVNLENLVNTISKIINFKNSITFINESEIKDNIMKPNLDKFINFFPDFEFTEIEKSLEITIENFTLVK